MGFHFSIAKLQHSFHALLKGLLLLWTYDCKNGQQKVLYRWDAENHRHLSQGSFDFKNLPIESDVCCTNEKQNVPHHFPSPFPQVVNTQTCTFSLLYQGQNHSNCLFISLPFTLLTASCKKQHSLHKMAAKSLAV